MAAPASVEMISKLVSFDTTSRDSNLALIDFVGNYLDDLGVRSSLTFDDDRRKANLFATIGPDLPGGIVLSGHTDVVPVDGQDWTADPFAVAWRDDSLFGRGTADMKSFVAVALALAPEMVRRTLRRPIHLAFTYDEEIGCFGVRKLLAGLDGRDIRPRACIVGEPTMMRPITAHKGKKTMRCQVHGRECHSALAHTGVNAVEAGAEIIAYLKGMARRFREHGPFDPDFTPPYTTVHTGTVHGGTTLNIVPKDCVFDFEFRYLPTEDPEALYDEVQRFARERLLPEMLAIHPATGFEFDALSGYDGLSTGIEEEVTSFVMQLTGADKAGKVSFGTEGGLYQAAGFPTIVCGPGSIEQAHKPDEFITLDQITACETFMRRIIDRAVDGS